MADISKIKLPSGGVYDIKDAVAREAIAGGISFIIAWNGNSVPVVSNIPSGVQVVYQGTTYTGTLSAETTGSGTHAQPGAFYLVKDSDPQIEKDVYTEYVPVGTDGSKVWEILGHTEIDLSSLGELAYKDNVNLNKGTGDNVLGENTTFNVTNPTITVTDPTINVETSKTKLGVTATGTSVSDTKSKMVLTNVPNVTSIGNASTFAFNLGSGSDSETLIISGSNSTAPTLGTAVTVATGSLSASGTGAEVVTSTSISQQPTVTISTGAETGPEVLTNITSITATATSATASGTAVTANNTDIVKVAKYDDLSVTAS